MTLEIQRESQEITPPRKKHYKCPINQQALRASRTEDGLSLQSFAIIVLMLQDIFYPDHWVNFLFVCQEHQSLFFRDGYVIVPDCLAD